VDRGPLLSREDHPLDGIETRLRGVADRARERELSPGRGKIEGHGVGQLRVERRQMLLDPPGISSADRSRECVGEAKGLDVVGDAAEKGPQHLWRDAW
jgi:hypothetical protein